MSAIIELITGIVRKASYDDHADTCQVCEPLGVGVGYFEDCGHKEHWGEPHGEAEPVFVLQAVEAGGNAGGDAFELKAYG